MALETYCITPAKRQHSDSQQYIHPALSGTQPYVQSEINIHLTLECYSTHHASPGFRTVNLRLTLLDCSWCEATNRAWAMYPETLMEQCASLAHTQNVIALDLCLCVHTHPFDCKSLYQCWHRSSGQKMHLRSFSHQHCIYETCFEIRNTLYAVWICSFTQCPSATCSRFPCNRITGQWHWATLFRLTPASWSFHSSLLHYPLVFLAADATIVFRNI